MMRMHTASTCAAVGLASAAAALVIRRYYARSPKSDRILIHVGTGFGDASSPTRAVLRLWLSAVDGTLSSAGEPVAIAAGENPGWLSRYARGIVYIGMEDAKGKLQAYSVGEGGELLPKGGAVSSVGRHPCYVALDTTGRWCFAANYTEGSVSVCPVLPDGSLGAATDSVAHQGSDLIDATLHDRQERAHCHAVVPHPSNRWVAVCDLGLSTVFVYAFDARRGTLSGAADDGRHLRRPADAGCRHACWDAAGRMLYVNNELDCTVTAARFDEAAGTLTAVQTVPALPAGVAPLRAHHRGGSDIQIHPNGRFVYAGMRSADPGVIAIFAVGAPSSDRRAVPPSGAPLRLVGHASTRGLVPRNMKLLGEGAPWLVVGNQETKSVVSFRVDPASGALAFVDELSTAPYKACNIASPAAHYA